MDTAVGAGSPGDGGGSSPESLESTLCRLLADVLTVEDVDPGVDFFADLGADSMVMTRFCARVRRNPELPRVAMKDIYRHRSIGALAASFAEPALDPAPPGVPTAAAAGSAGPVEASTAVGSPFDGGAPPASAAAADAPPLGRPHYLLCGVAQTIVLLGLMLWGGFLLAQSYEWVFRQSGLLGAALGWAMAAGGTPVRVWLQDTLTGPGVRAVYLRTLTDVLIGFGLLCVLPVLAKWLLIRRGDRRPFRVWSWRYLRFWTAKILIRTSPLALFVGTPIYVIYLRALGAKIGPGVAIFSRIVPACPDMLTIGANTVIAKDSAISGYRARAGVIEIGPVTIGSNVLVSAATILDIDTTMGDWSQLGHASSLHAGQFVPPGESWHGSPAQPSEVDYRKIEGRPCGTARRVGYSLWRLLSALVITGPVAFTVLEQLFTRVPRLAALLAPPTTALGNNLFWVLTLIGSYFLFCAGIVLGLISLLVLPRVTGLLLRPGRTYPLYGPRYGVYRMVSGLTNLLFFNRLFGDSAFVVGYLRTVGYRLRPVVQTGSNLGSEFKHDWPYLTSIGTGTMIADGLSVVNSDVTSTSFRVMEVAIGTHNFLGNKISYPTMGRTGANCLLATKVMVPIDGPVRENTGLLGSPAFEIPRTVDRDAKLGGGAAELRRRLLPAKNDHNVVTMGLYLLVRWGDFTLGLMLALIAADRYQPLGVWGIAATAATGFFAHIFYWVLVDRCVRGLQAFKPAGVSIYNRAFWRHERFWKVCDDQYLALLNGTPMKNLVWRALGVRIGRHVFDDGAFFPERSFVTIGDEVTLNADTHIQCHSQEDGAFKSDHTSIGARTTLGVGAFVHYGVTVGEDVELLPDTFVMKGEEIPDRARWGANPARDMTPPGQWSDGRA